MNIIVNTGSKLIYLDASRIEAEEETLSFFVAGEKNPVASITYDQYKDILAKEEAKYALLYLVDQIEKQNQLCGIRANFRFESIDGKIVKAGE